MKGETPPLRRPAGRHSIIYGLWTVALQAIFSMVYIWSSFVFKFFWAQMLPGEPLAPLTHLALDLRFQALCCCVTLCLVGFAWWNGRGMAEKQIRYLLLLMTADTIWGWITFRYAVYPIFRMTFNLSS